MAKIVKKDGKYCRQVITEEEVALSDLESELQGAKTEKVARLREEEAAWDSRIADIQAEIDQLKILQAQIEE